MSNMADRNGSSCYNFHNAGLLSSPAYFKAFVLDGKSVATHNSVQLTLHGSNLYCDVFDDSCTKLALQVYARSFRDDPLYEKCKPLCGNEVPCMMMSTSTTRDRCDLKCICPPGGCREIVVIANAAVVKPAETMTVCEAEMQGLP
jgi:hypothetical protein